MAKADSARNKQKKHRRVETPSPVAAPVLWIDRKGLPPLLLAALTLFFYAAPLYQSAASIQWDAVDVHYSSQKYFSDNVLAGKLPYWTAYVYSGMPFLADPQTGAWYPLNWPFFLAGITPRAIQWELSLHAFLACFGMFLLVTDLLEDRAAALLAGLVYGFSGFFAGHSSHVGIFQGAALFPWLLWTVRRGVVAGWCLYLPAAAFTGACIVLAGHFQTALYSFFGLALFAVGMIIVGEPGWSTRGLGITAAATLAAALLAAVQVLPGLELTAQSIRASADYTQQTNGVLSPGALLTLFAPDHYGAVSGAYHGPGDITQFYFYQGRLVPLLAIVGLLLPKKFRWPALGVLIVPVWYALGPSAGLYRLIAWLPAFRHVRAPVHIWFIVTLAIALLSAGGAVWAAARFRKTWLLPALIVLSFLDLWYWNMNRNALAYSRNSFDEQYGYMAHIFARATAPIRGQAAFPRIWFENDSNSFGPMNSSLNSRTEVTYGYNPLELQRYADYRVAAAANPKLIDGLAATHRIDRASSTIMVNNAALPRVSIPRNLVRAATPAEARAALAHLAPAEQAIVETAAPPPQDPSANAQVIAYQGDRYRIRYMASAPTLLRVAVPWFPGWQATIGDQPVPTNPVDLALTGILVPAGTNEVSFFYRSSWFATGAAISLVSLAAVLVLGVWGWRKASLTASPRQSRGTAPGAPPKLVV